MVKIMKTMAKLVKITNGNEDKIKEFQYNFGAINDFSPNS
jgi:hypothetical protein